MEKQQNVREKLVELLDKGPAEYAVGSEGIADYLIAHGVTVQEWIPASEPPTRKDADKYGRVLVMHLGAMEIVNYKGPINFPDRCPYWMPLPEPKKGK